MQFANKYLIDKETLKRRYRIAGICTLILFIVAIVVTNPPHAQTPIVQINNDPTPIQNTEKDLEKPIANSQETTPSVNPFAKPAENRLVTRISDGDTFYIEGFAMRTRLIGIDTPEIYDPNATYTCYGTEAAGYVTNLLLGQKVGIETDTNTGTLDTYGRPLLYIYYNGKNINYELIRLGYARENDYGNDYKYKAEFLAAQTEAQQHQRGLWSPNTCNGN